MLRSHSAPGRPVLTVLLASYGFVSQLLDPTLADARHAAWRKVVDSFAVIDRIEVEMKYVRRPETTLFSVLHDSRQVEFSPVKAVRLLSARVS
jgi:hypothetical protein